VPVRIYTAAIGLYFFRKGKNCDKLAEQCRTRMPIRPVLFVGSAQLCLVCWGWIYSDNNVICLSPSALSVNSYQQL